MPFEIKYLICNQRFILYSFRLIQFILIILTFTAVLLDTNFLINLFFISVETKQKRRGRPRLSVGPKMRMAAVDIDAVMKGPSYPLELVTTKVGGMKAAFQKHIFEFHFNRNGVKFWKCTNHTIGCPARIISKENLVYPCVLEHNHQEEEVLFISTSEIVEEKPAVVQKEESSMSINDTPLTGQELKMRMKERFAAIGRKLQKN